MSGLKCGTIGLVVDIYSFFLSSNPNFEFAFQINYHFSNEIEIHRYFTDTNTLVLSLMKSTFDIELELWLNDCIVQLETANISINEGINHF